MVYLSDMPEKQRNIIVDQELPDYKNTPCADGPPLSKRKISIITTAGLHKRGDKIFTPGVGEYRIIPNDININDLIMSHVSTNFDRTGFYQDLNVMLPIDRLNELQTAGKVGEVAEYHYAFMGATLPMAQETVSKDLAKVLIADGVNGVILAGVWPQCTRAVGGLAHYLEREGIPTTQISLVRKHTEVMKPPRALFVPFELGRPFGPPNNPKLQQEVLFEALKLLERHDGPIIEDYIPPFTAPNVTEEENEGWICPVNLAIPDSNLSDAQKLALNLKQEVNLLQPWYNLFSESSGGRELDGLTTYSPEEIIDLLVNFIEDPDIVSFVSDQPIGRALKITSDDLKHFYFQSAMARPKNISDGQLGDWFYGETLAGKLLIKIRAICLVHENKSLQLVGRTNFVPNAMLKYV